MRPNNECPVDHENLREELDAYQSDLQRIREEVQMLRREKWNLKCMLEAVLDRASREGH